MAYSVEWLSDKFAARIILVELTILYNSTPTTIYLSSSGYNTLDGSIIYSPYIIGSVQFSESMEISVAGGASMSYGDIEIYNPNGIFDSWLNPSQYIWTNGTAKIYFGDSKWQCTTHDDILTDFKLIFNGLIKDIDSRSINSLNIKFRDKMERLNVAVTDTKLGTYGTWSGGQSNQETIIPLVFGEVFNYEPLLIDPSQLEYKFSLGESEQLIEIRDNGVPIYTSNGDTSGATVVLSDSTFKLTHAPAGTITVSAQGTVKSLVIDGNSYTPINAYSNSITHIIGTLVTEYGKEDNRLSTSELDIYNPTAYNTPVGYLIQDRTNMFNVCSDIAGSIGGQLYFNRIGKLQMLSLTNSVTNGGNITEEDMVINTFSIKLRTEVIGSVRLGYCKNWYVQNNLITGIPESSKDSFATEWLELLVSDNTTITNYKLDTSAEMQETYLIKSDNMGGWAGGADVQISEANRRLDLFKIPRTVYKFTGVSSLLRLELGQEVNLKHSRFGLSGGVTGIITALSPDWLSGKVEVEVFV